jgi:signal transduction histidine kinase
VRANAALLREALLELIENGCRHGVAGGTVAVSAFHTADGARIAVRSSGDPFTLGARTGNGARVGGLGLPIVRWIAEAHGGTLTIERAAADNVVVLTLPLSPSSTRLQA